MEFDDVCRPCNTMRDRKRGRKKRRTRRRRRRRRSV